MEEQLPRPEAWVDELPVAVYEAAEGQSVQ
jgi:hypothetical protein